MNAQLTAASSTLLVSPPGGELRPVLDRLAAEGRLTIIDVYDLEQVPLTCYKGVLISQHADQRHLQRLQPKLEAFLGQGGILVFCGHVAHPFLPELTPFVPLKNYKLADLQIQRAASHPIWDGVTDYDLTFRKGVAGFHGRGYNPPPPGALIINTLGPQRLPLDWEYRRPGGGTLVVHSGNNLWNHLDDDTTLARCTPQLLHWIEQEGRAVR